MKLTFLRGKTQGKVSGNKLARAFGLLLALLLALMLIPTATVLAVPLVPATYYGTVTVANADGTPFVPAGTEISAEQDAITWGYDTVNGSGWYGGGPFPIDTFTFEIPIDDPNSPEVEGPVNGSTVDFYVEFDGQKVLAAQDTVNSGDFTRLDLTINDTFPPVVTINALTPDPTSDTTPTFTGTATDTLCNVTGIEYSVDSGAWTAVDAFTAALSVNYTFTTGVLGNGAHTVKVRATDAAGNTTAEANYATDDFTVSGVGPTYTVTYDGNGSTGGTVPVDGNSPYASGATVTVLGNTGSLVRTGYTFANWNTAANGSGTSYAAGNTFVITANTILYAQWTINTYTVTYNGNGSTGGTVPVDGNSPYNYNATVTVLGNTGGLVRTGYTFVNWNTAADGSGTSYAPSATFVITSNTILYAHWISGTLTLQDMIDATPPGGTLNLPCGNFYGPATIHYPITIAGQGTCTVINGSITVQPLTGSTLILENLYFTVYTDFAVRFVQIKAVDTYIVRNCTFAGVAGSQVGILVDEVVGGGTLTIEYNDITGNAVAGVQVTSGSGSAEKNWWGAISGPKQATTNPRGEGNAVIGAGADYQPWLTRDFATVIDENIAYFGYAMVNLTAGWNLISIPIAPDPAVDTWGEYVAMGEPDLHIHPTNPSYVYNGSTKLYEAIGASYVLKPGDAIFVRMTQADIAPVLFSGATSFPVTKTLYPGWNVVGLASLEDMPVTDALTSIYLVAGDLTGYSQVVSPAFGNQTAWVYLRNGINVPVMQVTKGYWIYMVNAPAGTALAGFTFTPIALP